MDNKNIIKVLKILKEEIAQADLSKNDQETITNYMNKIEILLESSAFTESDSNNRFINEPLPNRNKKKTDPKEVEEKVNHINAPFDNYIAGIEEKIANSKRAIQEQKKQNDQKKLRMYVNRSKELLKRNQTNQNTRGVDTKTAEKTNQEIIASV
jgi:hypothetical protein